MLDDAPAQEQPEGDSQAQGIFNVEDAAELISQMPYDDQEETPEIEEEESPEMESEESDQESEDQPEEDAEDQPDTTDELPSDDLVIAVDGETKVTLGELRESFQKKSTDYSELESVVTKKTQALAEQIKTAEKQTEETLASYQLLTNSLSQGLQHLDQNTNWQELKTSDIAAYNEKLNQRNQLEAQLQGFSEQAQGVLQQAQNARTERRNAESKAALDYLHKNIEGWNQDLYQKVAKHAGSLGVANFMEVRDGAIIKAIHDNMRHDEAKQKALQKVKGKNPKEAQGKGQKRDTRTAKERTIAKLEKRVRDGDSDAAIELLMMKPRN